MSPRILAAALALALLPLASSAHAVWISNGTAVCTATGDQLLPQIVSDGGGGAIICWEDRRGGGYDIYAQRLTDMGNVAPGWPANGRVVCNGTGDQRTPVMIADGAGGAIIAWQDRRSGSNDIYALRLTGAGAVAPGWMATGTLIATGAGHQMSPGIARDGADGAVIGWADARNGIDFDIYAHHVSGAGVLDATWPAGGALVCGTSGDQTVPRALRDGAGGITLTWTDERPSGRQVWASRVTATGAIAAGWPANGLLVISAWYPGNDYATTQDGTGGLYVAWDGIFLSRVAGDGTLPPGWESGVLNVHAGYAPDIAADGVGGVLVAWYEAYVNVAVTRIGPNALRYPGWPLGVPLYASQWDHFNPQVVNDGMGGAYVVWMDRRNDPYHTDIYMNRVLGSGRLPALWMTEGQSVCTAGTESNGARVVSDGQGGAITVWQDWRNGDYFYNQNADLYAQKLVGTGPVPVLVSLASADASPERVTVTWHLAGGSPLATVERSTGGAWSALGTRTPDGTGAVVYEDRDVTPGARYGYRLVLTLDGVPRAYGETWVEVPTSAAFALRGPVPNPAARELVVSFALPDGTPAVLELLDVQGRRLARHEVGSLGAGRHLVNLGGTGGLDPGIYLVRLTQGTRLLTARACVTR